MGKWGLSGALAGAALIFGLLVAPGSAHAQLQEPPADPTPAQIEQAKQHMTAGVAFMNDPDGAKYEEAYPEFQKAYSLSGSLNALLNLAICAMNLELDGEAIEYYGIVLEKNDRLTDAERTQVQSDYDRLKSTTAWVTLKADNNGVKLEDVRTPRSGTAIRNRYTIDMSDRKLGIHPGDHTFTANFDGKSRQWTVRIENGGTYSHTFEFDKEGEPVTAEGFDTPQPEPTDPGPSDGDEGGGIHPAVWVVGGVTVASAITWGAMMGVSAANKADYDDNIRGIAPLDEQQAAADDLQTINLVADVFLGVTIAGVATTIVLALTLDGDDGGDTGSDDGPRFGTDYRIVPLIDPRGGGAAAFTASF